MNYGERNLKKPGDEVSFRSVFTSHSVAPHEDATEVALADAFVAAFMDREQGRDMAEMAPLMEALAAVTRPEVA